MIQDSAVLPPQPHDERQTGLRLLLLLVPDSGTNTAGDKRRPRPHQQLHYTLQRESKSFISMCFFFFYCHLTGDDEEGDKWLSRAWLHNPGLGSKVTHLPHHPKQLEKLIFHKQVAHLPPLSIMINSSWLIQCHSAQL